MEDVNRFTRFYTDNVPFLLRNMVYKKKTILDLGAGDGEIIYGLWRRGLIGNDTKVIAVEISPYRCETMREMAKQTDINMEVIEGDATNLYFLDDHSIDLIICNQVLEHIHKEYKVIKEMHRVIKPMNIKEYRANGGRIYLSTVFKKPFNFGYYWNKYGERVLDPTHVREYIDESLVGRLEKYFTIGWNDKTLQCFAITDFILKRLGLMGNIYERVKILKWLRYIKLPIMGYFNWEFILWKK